MDLELRDALDQIRQQVDATAEKARVHVDAIEAKIRAGVEASEEKIRARVAASEEKIRAHVEASEEKIRAHVDATVAEGRRHFEVIAEGLQGQIMQLAEGVAALGERNDRHEDNLREEILRSQRELSAMLRFSYAELDRKIQGLEERVSSFEARLQRLEGH